MFLRALGLTLLLTVLLGATSSSSSVLALEFSSKPPSTVLSDAAVRALERSGFRVTERTPHIVLQYGGHAIWATVSSVSAGSVSVSLRELRGGCGHNPEVTGAKVLFAGVRASLESEFGPGEAKESHVANQSPQPSQ